MSHKFDNPTQQLRDLLNELVEKSESMIAMLITKEGTVLAEAGDTACLNTTGVAALVAGMYSATREVARMVGEDQFSIMLQQGENHHIHISLIADDTMLVIVFEDYQRIGRVRHQARKTTRSVVKVLEKSRQNKREIDDDLSASEFKEVALNLVDRIFQSK